jgi:Fe-S cluster biogenesis protein NfuA
MNSVFNKVQEALKQIRPFLEADGGDIELIEITKNNIARVKFSGTCKTCSMSQMTLKAGVEETVKRAVPEIIAVETIENT